MKNKKTIIIIAAAVAIITAIVVIVLLVLNKKDSYRVIKAFEVDGKAIVTRSGKGEIEAYNNMVLESGDVVNVVSGTLTIKMDEDKFAYAEEDTEFELIAKGTAASSRTSINLRKGAITSDVKNKLSEDSSYEVNTPNSVMTIHGTIFRVCIYEGDDGMLYSKLSVFDGGVETRLVYPDGTVATESVVTEKGEETVVYQSDDDTDYLKQKQEIDYSELPKQCMEILLRIAEDGEDVGITPEEIKEKIEEIEEAEERAEKGPFTVNFMYNGTVFGSQIVEKGEKATMPKLSPSPSGSWNFDFSTPIMKDEEVEWK